MLPSKHSHPSKKTKSSNKVCATTRIVELWRWCKLQFPFSTQYYKFNGIRFSQLLDTRMFADSKTFTKTCSLATHFLTFCENDVKWKPRNQHHGQSRSHFNARSWKHGKRFWCNLITVTSRQGYSFVQVQFGPLFLNFFFWSPVPPTVTQHLGWSHLILCMYTIWNRMRPRLFVQNQHRRELALERCTSGGVYVPCFWALIDSLVFWFCVYFVFGCYKIKTSENCKCEI